jgi:hypothetical protein
MSVGKGSAFLALKDSNWGSSTCSKSEEKQFEKGRNGHCLLNRPRKNVPCL